MTTTDAPANRRRRRRTVFIVSLLAVLILGAIGTSLAMLTGTSDGDANESVSDTVPNGDITKFDDPQGTYTVNINPRWQAATNPTQPEVESWFTGTGTVDFRDNINIISQNIGEVDLDQYLQLVLDESRKSLDNYSLKEFRLVTLNQSTATTTKIPQQLGVVAYQGKRGGKAFGFFFVASVENGNAVLATLTTAQDRFDEVRAQVEPYLMTLRQT